MRKILYSQTIWDEFAWVTQFTCGVIIISINRSDWAKQFASYYEHLLHIFYIYSIIYNKYGMCQSQHISAPCYGSMHSKKHKHKTMCDIQFLWIAHVEAVQYQLDDMVNIMDTCRCFVCVPEHVERDTRWHIWASRKNAGNLKEWR